MRIPTLLRQIPDGGYIASAFDLSAEGTTVEGAIDTLKGRLRAELDAGARIVEIDLDEPIEDHPLAPFAGMFRHDPLFDEWQKAVVDYRRQVDEDSSIR